MMPVRRKLVLSTSRVKQTVSATGAKRRYVGTALNLKKSTANALHATNAGTVPSRTLKLALARPVTKQRSVGTEHSRCSQICANAQPVRTYRAKTAPRERKTAHAQEMTCWLSRVQKTRALVVMIETHLIARAQSATSVFQQLPAAKTTLSTKERASASPTVSNRSLARITTYSTR